MSWILEFLWIFLLVEDLDGGGGVEASAAHRLVNAWEPERHPLRRPGREQTIAEGRVD